MMKPPLNVDVALAIPVPVLVSIVNIGRAVVDVARDHE